MNPDGIAIDRENNYIIIWDAKARNDKYKIGTDYRAIADYTSRVLKLRKKHMNIVNVYFMIVSSNFADNFDDTINILKMETAISEVILMEADALVEIVSQKLRFMREITLGVDGIQRLFTKSGVLTAEKVKTILS